MTDSEVRPLVDYVRERREGQGMTLTALAALPAPPDAGAIRAAAVHLATVADLLAIMQPPELRALLAELGTVVVSDAGVCVRYRPPYDALLAGAVVAVPRWGKGYR